MAKFQKESPGGFEGIRPAPPSSKFSRKFSQFKKGVKGKVERRVSGRERKTSSGSLGEDDM